MIEDNTRTAPLRSSAPPDALPLLDRYGFQELPRGGFKHRDGRELHFNATNWTLIEGGQEQRVLATGSGLQELGCYLALTHVEKSVMRHDRDLVPFARLNEPTERAPR